MGSQPLAHQGSPTNQTLISSKNVLKDPPSDSDIQLSLQIQELELSTNLVSEVSAFLVILFPLEYTPLQMSEIKVT